MKGIKAFGRHLTVEIEVLCWSCRMHNRGDKGMAAIASLVRNVITIWTPGKCLQSGDLRDFNGEDVFMCPDYDLRFSWNYYELRMNGGLGFQVFLRVISCFMELFVDWWQKFATFCWVYVVNNFSTNFGISIMSPGIFLQSVLMFEFFKSEMFVIDSTSILCTNN